MNLADSMQSQDNIKKMGHREEYIKENGEEHILLPMDRVTGISVRRYDQKLPEKISSM